MLGTVGVRLHSAILLRLGAITRAFHWKLKGLHLFKGDGGTHLYSHCSKYLVANEECPNQQLCWHIGCGFPGHIRIAYGRPDAGEKFQAAADALNGALRQLAKEGPAALDSVESVQ